MEQVHETEVNGVRCFWIDSGRPTLNASLLFRAGLVDESFTTHGWHHLIEHSALHGKGGGALHVNGSVSLTTTSFDCHGPIDLVVEHLSAVTAWLAAPEFGGVDREISVLIAEQRTRAWNSTAEAMLWRYGAQGPGLAAMDEYGLTRATPSVLTDLAAKAFARGNAVLVLDGPPPPELRLNLAEDPGSGTTIPPAVPCQADYPAQYLSPGLVVSGTVDRSVAATLLPSVLETRIRKQFRDRAGASYAPWSVYESVDSTTAVVLAGTDVNEVVTPESALRATEIVARTVEFGAEAQDLKDLVAQIVQGMRDPYNRATFAWRAGHRSLIGHEPETPDEIITGIESVTVDDLAEVAAQFNKTLMIGAPEKAAVPRSLQKIERPPSMTTNGARFRSRDWPADESLLIVGDTHAAAVGRNEAVSIRYDDLVGVIRHPHGRRVLIASDSWNMTLDPSQWTDGERAVGLIDERVPQDLIVDAMPGEEYLSHQRMSWWRRWWYGFGKSLGARNGTVFGFVVTAMIGSAAIAVAVAAEIWVVGVMGAIFIGRGFFDLVKGEAPEETPREIADLRRFRDANK